jgi:hypothetical protein
MATRTYPLTRQALKDLNGGSPSKISNQLSAISYKTK